MIDWDMKLPMALGCVKQGYPLYVVAKMMDVSQDALSDHLKKYEEYLSYKESLYIMPPEMKPTLDGVMVGDGHISPPLTPTSSTRFIYGLGLAQLEHAEELADRMKDFGCPEKVSVKISPLKANFSWTHPMFVTQRKRWYPNGTKCIPDDLSNEPEMWRWLYAGDGSLVASGKYSAVVRIAVCAYAVESVDKLRAMLQVHGIVASRNRIQTSDITGMDQYVICLSTGSTEQFLKMTSPPVRSIEYKWYIPEKPTLNCRYCDKEFLPERFGMIFCSRQCGVRASHPTYTKDPKIKALYRDYQNTQYKWRNQDHEPEEKFMTFSQWCTLHDSNTQDSIHLMQLSLD